MLGVRLPESPNLPLLRDVLEKAATLEAEYTVFTLADIAFMPDFYRQARCRKWIQPFPGSISRKRELFTCFSGRLVVVSKFLTHQQ